MNREKCTKSPSNKVLWWALFKKQNHRFRQVGLFRVHEFLELFKTTVKKTAD